MAKNYTTKPFNLNKALSGHPLITREGEKVEWFGFNSKTIICGGVEYPFKYRTPCGDMRTVTANGQQYVNLEDNPRDLFLLCENQPTLKQALETFLKDYEFILVSHENDELMYKIIQANFKTLYTDYNADIKIEIQKLEKQIEHLKGKLNE